MVAKGFKILESRVLGLWVHPSVVESPQEASRCHVGLQCVIWGTPWSIERGFASLCIARVLVAAALVAGALVAGSLVAGPSLLILACVIADPGLLILAAFGALILGW